MHLNRPLGDFVSASAGGTPKRSNKSFYGGDIPWIKSGDLNSASIEHVDEHITVDAIKNSSAKWVEPDSVLIAMYGATAGKVSRLKVKATTNQAVLALKSKDENALIDDYLFWLMNGISPKLVSQCQGAAQPNLNKGMICDFRINIPPLEEQRKIAACLSTWDKAIDAYDRLIALKEKQKRGLMQSLFSEVDHTRAFSNILDVIIGGTPSRSNDQYWDKERQTENRWISIANMKSSVISDSTEYISEQGVNNSNVKLLETGTVIFSFKLSLGKKAILGKPCYTNEAIAGLVVKDEKTLNRDYLYHALSVVDIDKEIDQAVKGKTLNKAKLNRLRLPWYPVVNQVRIANILNGADNEIKALVKKRDLLKKQKQGLMQQLLA
jgi:type I restriction enzyme S subunit